MIVCNLNLKSKLVWTELACRAIVILIFLVTEELNPFHRVIQPEELALYRYPNKTSIVPSTLLWVLVFIGIFIVISTVYLYNKDLTTAICGLGVPFLALPLNGIITNIIKISVGRPRPDYLNRCYGEGYLHIIDVTKPCIGEDLLVMDGRKSFPSGHSSMSFCGFGFIFLYLAAQLKVFSSNRGRISSLLICFLPLCIATLIAISRTCDYHHHWQDVTVGSFLGFITVYVIYRQQFPSLTDSGCDKPVNINFSFEPASSDAINGRSYAKRESPSCVKTV